MKKLSCCQNVVNVLLVHCLGGFVMIYVSGSGNIFAFGAGWVGHAMQIGHGTIWDHQCILNIKETSQYHTNGWRVSWLVVLYFVLYDCCPFFVSLEMFIGFKRKYTWRSTADVKKWHSQWWIQLFIIIPQVLGLDHSTIQIHAVLSSMTSEWLFNLVTWLNPGRMPSSSGGEGNKFLGRIMMPHWWLVSMIDS